MSTDKKHTDKKNTDLSNADLRNVDLRNLETRLGYRFGNPKLLQAALTHRSKSNNNNERLEFLGDAILNLAIAKQLFHQFPKAREGELSRMRATIVKGQTLAAISRSLHLGRCLILGQGEIKGGGQHRQSILADALEALIGAVYLDSDEHQCHRMIESWFQNEISALTDQLNNKDAKTQLQEWVQSRQLPLPQYEVIEISGADHEQQFAVSCDVEALSQSTIGRGRSRRKAEQAAAELALIALNQLDSPPTDDVGDADVFE